jgi:hypothetical protein
MKKWIVIQIIVFLGCFGMLLTAQNLPGEGEEFEKLAQSTMTFLNIDVGGRGIGMGGAFTCMENDVVTLFWNPAGIAKIRGGAVSLNHTQWIGDTKQYALAAAYGSDALGTFGASFMIMDNGSINRTIPDPTKERGFYLDGSFNVSQWAGGVAYARQITNKFSVGAQIKYVYQDLGEADIVEWTNKEAEYDTLSQVKNQKGTLAFDFGTLYYLGFKDLRFGMSFRNFARPVKYSFESFNLPITFRVGVAMNVLSLIPDLLDHNLQVCVEAVHPYDEPERIDVGCEYVFKNLLAIRTGYRGVSDMGSLSFGFGLTPKAFAGVNVKIDYSYVNAEEVFGSINRFSFGFTF